MVRLVNRLLARRDEREVAMFSSSNTSYDRKILYKNRQLRTEEEHRVPSDVGQVCETERDSFLIFVKKKYAQ